jgi:nicotinate-nucleotide pyrophosphorylase (carboxylating)
MLPLRPDQYVAIVRQALDEDLGWTTDGGGGDVTTDATVAAEQRGRGTFLVKADCVLAGIDVAIATFRELEPGIEARFTKQDGQRAAKGEEIGQILGLARTLLVGERTALNFLQRLSGIATRTRQFVDVAAGRITVLDTRKTTPALRVLEKYAVLAGGATNHRFGLFDAILIKDNHVRLAGGVKAAVDRARALRPDLRLEVEAQTLDEVNEALDAGADIVLLDNMSTTDIRAAVERSRGRAKTEISGGVTLGRLPELAATGADFVSVGALTHSAPAVDISFEIEPI